MIHVGIDLHTDNMVNVAINDNGSVIREAKLPTFHRSLEDFFGTFGGPVQAVVECTSNWYWLSDWCRENEIPLTLAHAKMVKAISYAKVKTDKVDAQTLAELLRADLIPEAYQIKHDRRELRELTRGRIRMIQWRGKLQATLWSQSIKYNVQITTVSGASWRNCKIGFCHNCPRRPACKCNLSLNRSASYRIIPADLKKKLTGR